MDRKGKAFKGRACAEKVNADYRRMQADMYNLYPAIGSVNAVRSNKNFQMLGPDVPSAFGSCPMKISGNKVEPPGAGTRTDRTLQPVYGCPVMASIIV